MKLTGTYHELPLAVSTPACRYLPGEDTGTNLRETVIVEHEIEIYVNGNLVSRLTCSPEALHQLAAGHLIASGRVPDGSWLEEVALSRGGNRVDVTLAPGRELLPANPLKPLDPVSAVPELFTVKQEQIFAQAASLYEEADLFFKTGAAHSSSLMKDGAVLFSFTDVSRHNTVDKLVGQAAIDGVEPSETVLFTSGRIPLDMIEKTIRAGIPVVCSRSAPTSAALSLACEMGVTLIGFVREGRMTVYCKDDGTPEEHD